MTHPVPGPDQRRWVRHKIDVRLKITIEETNQQTIFGRGNTLNAGGMGAYIPCALPIGTVLTLRLTFPYSPVELTLEAVIRNSEGFSYGLEFMHLSDNARSLIVQSCNFATTNE